MREVLVVISSLSTAVIVFSSRRMPCFPLFRARTKLCKETWDLDIVKSPCILTRILPTMICKQRFPQFITESPKVASHWNPRTTLEDPNF